MGKAISGESMVEVEEPLSPAARLFQTRQFNCYIIAIIGCKTVFNSHVIKAGLEHTLIKHPRFSSLMVADKMGGEMRWIRTKVNVEDHVIIPNVDPNMGSPDQFIENYISNMTKTYLDDSKPLWDIHLLNVKTSEAESTAIFRIHHSIGDGMSIMSLVLACTRKTSDLNALPTIPTKKRQRSSNSGRFIRLVSYIWFVLQVICNTLVDVVMFIATSAFLRDTRTPLKGAPGVELSPKWFVHKTISLDDIKLVKNAMDLTINDVILGVTQAGLSRYLNRQYGEGNAEEDAAKQKRNNLPRKLRFRAALIFNIRPSMAIEALADMMERNSKTKWGNYIGYALLPITIALRDDPLDYVREAKAMVDRKKRSLEAKCTFLSAKYIVNLLGAKVAAAISYRVISNTTMSFSNVVGPVDEISFYGHPMAYLAPSVYGHPHALTVHFQSYMNMMTISLAVDRDAVPDPHQLCNDLAESLKLIKDAVVKKGLAQESVQR
ncbi:O-acyltransferase WSD1-like isoform X2 [Vitis riparia]|uniref:O-acyltransferase WSD1-like isoform X2 n=1 Tax=Vitis riparia TaxID=96939 RepID=UPI00155A2CF7|nr:O-acyltransferase WSD1-like isoform X2 [Vitis riparia]